jgi:Protein kinase domain
MLREPGIGSIVAGHRIDALVARGGMGVVYRVTHLSLGRERALKLIAPELAADEQFRARFRREWRTAASIEHPHVIPIHDAGEANGHLYIAMRYVPGTDLRQLLAERGALDVELAALLMAQVSSALDAAHERGLIHRDIKPANILIEGIDREPHAYLTDFGLTKQASSTLQLTGTGHWLGTVDYVAPEQAEGKPVDARTDIYGLGCVLFQTITGEVPYPRNNDVAKIWAHVNDPPPSPSKAAPELPRAMDEVVQRAMAKDPGKRYQSAGEFGRATVAAAGGGAAKSVTRPTPRTAVQVRRRARPYAATGLVLALVLAAVGIVGLLSGGDGRDGAVVTPVGNPVADYQAQVGQICSELNDVTRQTARRTPAYRRRLKAARSVQALRDVIVAETQQRTTTANALSARLAGLAPPSARLRAEQRATLRAYRRNISRQQSFRDRLKGVGSYAELSAVSKRFDAQRTATERSAARTRAGLHRLGGPECDLEIPPPPKPVSLPPNPEPAESAPPPAEGSDVLPSAPPEEPAPVPDVSPAPPADEPVEPAPDVNPVQPNSPDVNPPSYANPPDANPPPPAAGGGG